MIKNTKTKFPSSRIVGLEIKNSVGEPVGKVESLMIDWYRATVAYVVISCGYLTEMSDILFAVPLEAFQFDKDDPDEHKAILDVNQTNLRYAPGFDKEYWPSADNHNFTRVVYSHYGVDYKFDMEMDEPHRARKK